MFTREQVKVDDVIKFSVPANNVHGMVTEFGRVMQVYNSYVVVFNSRIQDVLYCNIASNMGKLHPADTMASKKGVQPTPIEKPGASLAEMKLAVAFAVHLNEEHYRAKVIDLALATGNKELFMTWSRGVSL